MRMFLSTKKGHNFETEVKLNKAQHTFSNELSLSMATANSVEDTHKRT